MSEPTFAAAKIKLDLAPKFAGKPSELFVWLFEVEQYCDIMGIVKPIDRVRLAVFRLERDALTWWHQLNNHGDDCKLGKLVWFDFKAELVSEFSNFECELRLYHQLDALM